MVKKTSLNRIKIFSAIILLISSIILYIILHGTKELIIVKKINQFCKIIPLINGIRINQKFITGYLIDILWFNSFCLLFSFFKKKIYFFILTLFACVLECAQLVNPILGTFDVLDLLIYIITGISYYAYEKIINKD